MQNQIKKMSILPRLTSAYTNDLIQRKVRACHLVVIEGHSQKEASQKVGVTEKTISKWARKGKWNDQKFNGINKPAGGLETIMEDFFIVVKSKDHTLYKKVTELWSGYLQELKKNV
jgi:hypothetical protein